MELPSLLDLLQEVKKVSSKKAKKILKHGEVKGKKLSKKQRKFFGALAGGQKARK